MVGIDPHEEPPLAIYGQFVTVTPPACYFRGIEPGVRHVLTLSVSNVSVRGRRVRFVPPRSPAFTLRVDNDVELAPGLELRADLYFCSDQATDFHDQLMVLVGRSEGEMEQITIPVTALLPCARMELDTTMHFGPVVHQTSVTRQLLVRNTGERPGTLNFVPPAEKGGPKFAVHPASGVVDAGKQRLLKVECPADLPLGKVEGEIPIVVDGGSGPSALHVSADVVVQTLELRSTSGKPLEKLDFGPLYCGLKKTIKAVVVNTGPNSINFSVSKALQPDAPPEEGGVEVLTISPPMGALRPYTQMELAVTFAPPKAPKAPKGFIKTASEAEADEKFGRETHAVQQPGEEAPGPFDDPAPSAPLVAPGALAAPTHPRARQLERAGPRSAPQAARKMTKPHFQPPGAAAGGGARDRAAAGACAAGRGVRAAARAVEHGARLRRVRPVRARRAAPDAH